MVETNAEGHPLRLKLRAVKGMRKAAIKRLGAGALAPGTRVVSGGRGCFRAVTDIGCRHQPMVTGSGARAVRIPAFK